MHPGAAIGVADEVGVIVLDCEVVDREALRPALPFDGLDHQRRASTRDNRVPNCQPACRSEAFALDVERMFSRRRDRLDHLTRLRIRKSHCQHERNRPNARLQDALEAGLARPLIPADAANRNELSD